MRVGRFSWGAVPAVPAAAAVCAPFVLPDVLRARLPFALAARLEDAGSRIVRAPFEYVEEIRLRACGAVGFTVGGRNVLSDVRMTPDGLNDVLSGLCRGSLYAYEQEIRQGYLSLPDGIRVGVAGDAAADGGMLLGVRSVTSLCIRLPHPSPDAGRGIARMVYDTLREGSPAGTLIYGAPGVGKTTMLRAAAVSLSLPPYTVRTVVVDTRRELGAAMPVTGCLDVLSGYPRALGIGIAVRTLNAQVIVMDEIGGEDEAGALIGAHRGGVPLLCSAHAASVDELLSRPGIRRLVESGLFRYCVGITRNGRGGFVLRVTDVSGAPARLVPHDRSQIKSIDQ